MGTNGVTGAKEVVFGSNTINVIRNVNCTTLVVPEGFVYTKTHQILLPLDTHDTLSVKTFEKASSFINKFGKKIHALRIKSNSESVPEEVYDKKQIKHFLKKLPAEYHRVSDVPMSQVVDCYIQTREIDLMILLVQQENLLERIFTGSTTTRISKTLRVPLLVFHC